MSRRIQPSADYLTMLDIKAVITLWRDLVIKDVDAIKTIRQIIAVADREKEEGKQ